MNQENTSESFSTNEPITQDAALEQILGIVNPKGQIEDESTAEEPAEEEVVEEAATGDEEETEEEATDEESVETDAEEDSDVLELDDDEFNRYTQVKAYMEESGIKSVDDLKGGSLRQSDYTQKTQALAEERKSFEVQRTEQLEQAAQAIEVAQAIIFGQAPKLSSAELQALKETDPSGYEEALEQKVLYDTRKGEIDAVTQRLAQQHQQSTQAAQEKYALEQAELAKQLVPALADEKQAEQVIIGMKAYLADIGQDASILNDITDARMLRVLYDASNKGAPKPVKRGPKRVIRKATSASKGEKQAAAQKQKYQNARAPDGSIDRNAAVDLILDSFN